MERRRYKRVFPHGLSAEISDGIGYYRGVVSNVSLNGISIEELPSRIDGNAPWFIVMVRDRHYSFRIFLKPKWSIQEGSDRSIGGVIVDPSWDWADFVHTLIKMEKGDVPAAM